MRPYSGRNLSEHEEIYNYRLSRARRIVECAFGILCSKWRILKKEIECHPDKADIIVKCACILHNIIIDKERCLENNFKRNSKVINVLQKKYNRVTRNNNRSTVAAYAVRDKFKNYFSSLTGSVPFQ